MSIRTLGRTLGLGAVMLSAILLIVALLGGMTIENPKSENPKSATVLAHAAAAGEEHPALSSANRPSNNDRHLASDQAGLPGVR